LYVQSPSSLNIKVTLTVDEQLSRVPPFFISAVTIIIRYYFTTILYVSYVSALAAKTHHIIEMRLTRLATVSLFIPFKGSLALPVSATTVAAVNVFDLSASRVNTALKELSAEMSNIFIVQSAQWNEVAQSISAKTDAVIQVTKYSAASMRAAEPLGSSDAFALWGPVQQLSASSDEVSKKFVQMKNIVFQMNNGQRAILEMLASLKESTNEFTIAMSSKMPFLYKYVGEYYGNSINSMVTATMKEYQNPPQVTSGYSW
jgi:hypothetical protein